MSDLQVNAEERSELGKNASRRIRRAGKIPVVVYGRGITATSLTVDPRDLIHVLQSEHGQNTIFRVNYGQNSQDVLIRDIQLDPVKGTPIHADLQKVAMDETMTFEVPIEVLGDAPGVELGGILELVTREIEIECLPGDVPESIEVDISQLQIGALVRVADLQIDTSKITVLSDEDVVVVAIAAPIVEEEEAAEAEEILEPEVIHKGKADEDEGKD